MIRERVRQWMLSEEALNIVARGASSSFLIKLAGAALALLTQVVIARLLGVSEYGAYVYALSWINILSIFPKLGLGGTLTKFIPVYRSNGEWSSLKGILHFGFTVVVVLATIVMLIFVGFVYFRVTAESEYYWPLLLAALLIPVKALNGIRSSALTAFRRIVFAQFPGAVLRPLVLIGLVSAGVFLYGQEGTAELALVANVIAAVVVLAIGSILLMRVLPGSAREAKPEFTPRSWLRFSGPMLVMAAMYQVLNQTDTVMLGTLQTSEAAGMYSAAARLTSLMTFGLTAVAAIAAPMISELYNEDRMEELQNMLKWTARGLVVLSGATALFLLLGGKYFLFLFGSEFVTAYSALIILLVGYLVNSMTGPVGFVLIMGGRQLTATTIVVLSAMINIGLNWVLIPMWGVNGAAVATAGSMALWNVAMVIVGLRKMGINSTVFAR